MQETACPGYRKFEFQHTSGYLFHHPQGLIALGHTASVSPWQDPNVHLHERSEEYYVLFHGQLDVLIRDFRLTLYPNEILTVKPTVPHAILSGAGRIEHFGIRTPALDDKQIDGALKKDAPYLDETQRSLSGEWGYRIPLDMPQHQNCWLIGAGSALYPSQHFILAYMGFPTAPAANASVGTRDHPHLHKRSWEYYVVLEGAEFQQVDGALLPIYPGEILEVPPQVRHTLHHREAPYRGFTLRVPLELDDKVILEI